jgi:hypothetical protein
MTTNFFHPSLLLLFLDPGSGIRDPGSGMGKNQNPGSGIWDKHPGSATLHIPTNIIIIYLGLRRKSIELFKLLR